MDILVHVEPLVVIVAVGIAAIAWLLSRLIS